MWVSFRVERGGFMITVYTIQRESDDYSEETECGVDEVTEGLFFFRSLCEAIGEKGAHK
jgi:hypothetical protein